MPDSRLPNHHLERLDDLDVAAVVYARRWRGAGDDERHRLRDDLICRCVPFADRLARRYRGRPEPIEDLEQVARLGLVKAVDRGTIPAAARSPPSLSAPSAARSSGTSATGRGAST